MGGATVSRRRVTSREGWEMKGLRQVRGMFIIPALFPIRWQKPGSHWPPLPHLLSILVFCLRLVHRLFLWVPLASFWDSVSHSSLSKPPTPSPPIVRGPQPPPSSGSGPVSLLLLYSFCLLQCDISSQVLVRGSTWTSAVSRPPSWSVTIYSRCGSVLFFPSP